MTEQFKSGLASNLSKYRIDNNGEITTSADERKFMTRFAAKPLHLRFSLRAGHFLWLRSPH